MSIVSPSDGDGIEGDMTMPTMLSSLDERKVRALQLIRKATGTIFARDLYFVLDEPDALPTDARDRDVVDRLNSWFETPLVLVDSSSSLHIAGLVELVTDVRYRVFIDLLTGYSEGRRPRLHPMGVESLDRDGDSVEIRWEYAPLEHPPHSPNNSHDEWIDLIVRRHGEIAQESIPMPVVLGEQQLAQRIKTDPESGAITVDLAGAFVVDFRARDVLALARTGPGDPRIRLFARGAIFAGDIADFEEVSFDIVDLEWAVFLTRTVSFRQTVFSCLVEREEEPEMQTVNLRDVTFCDSVRSVAFDDARFAGDTNTLTFEDAVFRGAHLTFARTDFGSVLVDFYQAQFFDGARVEFIESKMSSTSLSFSDASFDVRDSTDDRAVGDSLVFYRVQPLPPTDLTVRKTGSVRIENSSVQELIRFACIERLSFAGTSITSTALTVKPARGKGDPRREGSDQQVWFFEAMQRGREDQRATLSAEFAAVKGVFQSMGQFDLEDEAFVRHMRFKYSHPGGRFAHALLDVVGRFGTSPHRTFGWLVATWFTFVLVNLVCMMIWPEAFDGTLGNRVLDAIVYTNASLTQSSASISPESFGMHLLWVLQTLFGWFFLGYLFSAFVRKTLR